MIVKVTKSLIRLLPEKSATGLVRALASRISRPRMTSAQKAALTTARKINYGCGMRNVAYSWGNGPLLVLIHGWGGQAAQMAPLALQLANSGFRCVAVDITGHGASRGSHSSWADFFKDIQLLNDVLGDEVFAYIGHSAGGLSAMAGSRLGSFKAQKYICISAPSFPYPPLFQIKKKLQPPSFIIEDYKSFLAEQFSTKWVELEAGNSFSGDGQNLLLFYDEKDRLVPKTEGEKIKSLCPKATLKITNSYSHSSIIDAPELVAAIKEFLPSAN
jgi:pimeloyl-ACP methyl ester carboxylesterase